VRERERERERARERERERERDETVPLEQLKKRVLLVTVNL
jgi:hypothetical protein